jgi:hypothetical protein
VTGEAAGLAMGLTELGSNSSTAIEDMVAYAQETQHEKILRGEPFPHIFLHLCANSHHVLNITVVTYFEKKKLPPTVPVWYFVNGKC